MLTVVGAVEEDRFCGEDHESSFVFTRLKVSVRNVGGWLEGVETQAFGIQVWNSEVRSG